MSEEKRTPFPIRAFMQRVNTVHKIHGKEGVLTLFAQEDNLQMILGILAVASEMEPHPEWQAMRMRMLSSVKHEQKLISQNLITEAARKYES